MLTLLLIDIQLITYTIFNTSFKAFPKVYDLRHGVSAIDLVKGYTLMADEELIQRLIFATISYPKEISSILSD